MTTSTSLSQRRINWIIVHIIYATVCFFALVQNSVGAGYVFSFLVWFSFICSFIAVSFENARTTLQKIGRSVPAWLSHTTGFAFAAFTLYHGWILIGTLIFISELFELIIFSGSEPETKPPSLDQ